MADNIYLLETRLSPAQQTALEAVRQVAREHGVTVFLVGGAVRDLMSGSPVRDLDVAVQGDALQLRTSLEKAGATFSGESKSLQALHLRFAGGVRVEVGSTLSVTYPKPAKPVYEAATILDDLRRRDFTANAMALSLNDGSYGLLMDPLNGVADIENRELRLVSNYGFIEDPVRMIRAARFMARLGWQMDERTKGRYDAGKEENYIASLGAGSRAYELEELFHEEEPLRVMRRLEEEGWLAQLSPILAVAKANAGELARLREVQMQLETRGIRADAAAANFPLLVAKVAEKDVEGLKKSFPRALFVAEIESLEASAKELGAQLLSKAMASPSEAYKLILRSAPSSVLWTMYSSRSAALQARFKSFLNDWPQAQSKIPFLLMTEMRITPEISGYAELQELLFFALMDGKLTTPEEMRAFLEPYSPPAPPPPVSLRRARATKKEAKAPKSRKKAAVEPEGGLEDTGDATPQAAPAPPTPSVPTPVAIETKKTAAKEKAPAAPVESRGEEAARPEPPPTKAKPVKQQAAKPVEPTKAAKAAPAKKAPAKPVKKAAATESVAKPAKKAAPAVKGSAAKKSSKAPVKVPAKKVVAKKGAAPTSKKHSAGKAPAKKVPAKKAAAKKAPAKHKRLR